MVAPLTRPLRGLAASAILALALAGCGGADQPVTSAPTTSAASSTASSAPATSAAPASSATSASAPTSPSPAASSAQPSSSSLPGAPLDGEALGALLGLQRVGNASGEVATGAEAVTAAQQFAQQSRPEPASCAILIDMLGSVANAKSTAVVDFADQNLTLVAHSTTAAAAKTYLTNRNAAVNACHQFTLDFGEKVTVTAKTTPVQAEYLEQGMLVTLTDGDKPMGAIMTGRVQGVLVSVMLADDGSNRAQGQKLVAELARNLSVA